MINRRAEKPEKKTRIKKSVDRSFHINAHAKLRALWDFAG